MVKLCEDSANKRSSYPTNKSKVALQARPAKCSANGSVAGGNPECAIVTLFNSSRLWTIRRLFPSFFKTVNHLDQYEELEGL